MAKELSVLQLERLLEAKRSRLETLLRQREQLQRKLTLIDDKISRIGGARGELPVSVRVRRRPKNDRTLLDAVLDVLGQSKKGYTLHDLGAKVLETGYKTGSANFSNTLYQCLYHNQDKIVCDPETRCYRLK